MDYTAKSTNILEFSTQLKKPGRKKKTILDDIKQENTKAQPIKIRTRKLKDGLHRLILDYWNVREKKHEYEFLDIFVFNKQKTYKTDLENLQIALKIRDIRKDIYEKDTEKFQLSKKKLKTSFLIFFKNIVNEQTLSIKPWKNTYNYLYRFTGGNVIFFDINEKFCEKFKIYLLQNVSQNSARTYFTRFKTSLRKAVKEKILTKSPAEFIKLPKEINTQRAFLTIDELLLLKETSCPVEETKQAFLFTCFTGLRYSDIVSIKFDQLEDGYLRFRQKKTEMAERIKLNKTATDIINYQRNKHNSIGQIFKLSAHSNTTNHLKKWAQRAGINKNISWHIGRHTFATLAITNKIDIYTVSKLLGHKNVSTTEIYAKLINQRKDDAIDSLPII